MSGYPALPIIPAMNGLLKPKIRQATGLLEELDLDLWLVFVRETPMHADPVLPMVIGRDVTWQSFFLYTRTGEAIALVGNFDIDMFSNPAFTEAIPYTAGVREDLQRLLARLDPKSIAVNYSVSDVAADGLTHGQYLLLQEYLKDTQYLNRLVSAEHLISKLRSRKLPEEQELLRKAAELADDVWQAVVPHFSSGQTEKQIASLIDSEIASRGFANSFNTIVNAGSKTNPGHGEPTDAVFQPGDLLHLDFGVRYNGYCSDIQRLAWLPRHNETAPPPELLEAFDTVKDIVTATARYCRPGVKGFEVDAEARRILRDNGYEEYQHALGHHIGRSTHDGGGVIGPKWERYGDTPSVPLENGNVFTLELEIILPGIGCVGLEEDVALVNDNAEFLSPRQMELVIL